MKLQFANALKFAEKRKQLRRGGEVPAHPQSWPGWRVNLRDRVDDLPDDGLIDALLAGQTASAGDEARTIAAFEECAIEASIMKVMGSEALGLLVDDAVQIHGGRASSRSTRWSGRSPTRASTASSRGRTRSTGCSSPGCC